MERKAYILYGFSNVYKHWNDAELIGVFDNEYAVFSAIMDHLDRFQYDEEDEYGNAWKEREYERLFDEFRRKGITDVNLDTGCVVDYELNKAEV